MGKLNFAISMGLVADKFKSGLKSAMASLKSFVTSMSGMFAGLGFAEMFRGMITAGRGFQQQMAAVKAVTGATAEEFKMMSDEAKRLGATTKYSASEAGAALENLTRNGLSAKDATESLSGVLNLASAGALDLAQAADIVTNTMNAFGMTAKDVAKINDILAYTASHSATSVTGIGESMVNVAPIAAASGISLEEVSAALGALANVGIKGAEAGTVLRQVILGLTKPTRNQAKAFKALGVDIDQNSVKANGLTESLQTLIDAGLMNAGNSNELLGAIFGSKATAAATSLLGHLEDMKTLLGGISTEADGVAANMAAIQNDTLEGSIKSLQSAWEALNIAIFETSDSQFKSIVDGVTSVVTYIKDNLSEVAKHIRNVLIGIGIGKMLNKVKASFASTASTIAARANVLAAEVEAQETKMLVLKEQIEKRKAIAAQNHYNAESAYCARTKQMEVQLEKQTAAQVELIRRQQEAEAAAASYRTSGVFSKMFTGIKTAAASAGTALKAAFNAAWPMMLITVIMEAIEWVRKYNAEVNRAKNLEKAVNEEIAKRSHTPEIAELETLCKMLNTAYNKHGDIAGIINKINTKLGTSYTKYEDINNALRDKIRLLRIAAREEGIKEQISKLEGENAEILLGYGGDKVELYKRWLKYKNTPKTALLAAKDKEGIRIKEDQAKFSSNNAVINKLIKQLTDSVEDELEIELKFDNGGGNGFESTENELFSLLSDSNKKKTPQEIAADKVKSANEDYAEKIAIAGMEYEEGILTEKEWQERILSAMKARHTAYNEATLLDNSYQSQLDKLTSDLKDQIKTVHRLEAAEASNEEMQRAEEEATKRHIAAIDKAVEDLRKQERVESKGRDKSADWKITGKNRDEEIAKLDLQFDLDNAKKDLAILQKAFDDGATGFEQDLNDAMSRVTSLEDRLQIADIQSRIRELRKEMQQVTLDSMQQGWQTVEGTVNAISGMMDKLKDPDASAWEKLCSVMNTLFTVISAIQTVMSIVNTIQQVSNGLSLAMGAAKTFEASATGAATGAAAAATPVLAAEAIAAKTAASAAEQLAAAEIFAAHAAIPFAGPGIAAGLVATMEGVMAGVKAASKFSTGGIVKGNFAHGDLVPAMLNAHEAVLTPAQQDRFMRIADGKTSAGGAAIPEVITLRASGDSLQAVINTNNRHRSRR